MSGYLGTKAVTLSTTSATVGGDSTVGGDLTVDTNTLYVDSANNRVGIGNAAPTQALDVTGDIVTSGGVYLGGTGSANHLDDYEEGTFTPTSRTNVGTAATFGSSVGQYTKIGNVVYFNIDVTDIDTTGTTSTSQLQIDGLPFTIDVDAVRAAVLWDNITFQSTRTSCVATVGTTEYIQLTSMGTGIADTPVDYGDLNSGVADVFISGFYYTDQ